MRHSHDGSDLERSSVKSFGLDPAVKSRTSRFQVSGGGYFLYFYSTENRARPRNAGACPATTPRVPYKLSKK